MITVLGDGAWGTAIATVLAHNGHEVLIWCHNHEVAQSIAIDHKNYRYLPKFELSAKITTTTDLKIALQSDIIFEAIPVKYMRSILEQCKSHVSAGQIWVSLSKGIENNTLLLPTELISAVLGDSICVAAVSGPSFAHDLAEEQPTGATIAADSPQTSTAVKNLLQTSYFCLEESEDLLGIQLAGALKNVFALGVGLLAGAGYGPNSQVLLLMRGIEESKRLFKSLGYNENTLYGLAGIGDLVLTCFGGQSRNYQVGVMLGQGKKLQEIIETTGFTPEGINTLTSIMQLSEQQSIKLPTCLALYKAILEAQPIDSLTKTLCK